MECTPPLARNNHEPGFHKPSKIMEDICKLTCQYNPCAMVPCQCPYTQHSQQWKAGLRFTNFKPVLFSNVLVIVTIAIETYRFCAYHTNLMMDGLISLEKLFYLLIIEHNHQISELTCAATTFFWLRALYVVLKGHLGMSTFIVKL